MTHNIHIVLEIYTYIYIYNVHAFYKQGKVRVALQIKVLLESSKDILTPFFSRSAMFPFITDCVYVNK